MTHLLIQSFSLYYCVYKFTCKKNPLCNTSFLNSCALQKQWHQYQATPTSASLLKVISYNKRLSQDQQYSYVLGEVGLKYFSCSSKNIKIQLVLRLDKRPETEVLYLMFRQLSPFASDS